MTEKLAVILPDKLRQERSEEIVSFLEEVLEKAKKGELSSILIYLEDWDGSHALHLTGCEDRIKQLGILTQMVHLRSES